MQRWLGMRCAKLYNIREMQRLYVNIAHIQPPLFWVTLIKMMNISISLEFQLFAYLSISLIKLIQRCKKKNVEGRSPGN